MSTIIVEGASTAEGQGGGSYGSWTQQVNRMVPDHDLYNRARAGMSISGINRKWEQENIASQLRGWSILRILSVGQNEARINPTTERPITPLDMFASQLAVFSRATKAAGLAPIYVGPQLVDESKTLPTPDTGWFIENDLIEEYAEVIRVRAQEDDVPYVDVAAEYVSRDPLTLIDADGRHPNAAGHEIIAHGVLRAMGNLGIETVPVLTRH